MNYQNLYITGVVTIGATQSLLETSHALEIALGVSFHEDAPGRYDEFPSFTANSFGLWFVLLGIPDLNEQISEIPITEYCLQIRPSITTKEATVPCDVSDYLALVIGRKSELSVILRRE